jgi:hypothetical protein
MRKRKTVDMRYVCKMFGKLRAHVGSEINFEEGMGITSSLEKTL